MTDTAKTSAELLPLIGKGSNDALPYNSGLGHGGQTGRDLITSLVNPYGGLYFSTPAETTIAEAGTYVKAAGTTTATNLSSHFTMPANNRLLYTGDTSKHFHVVLQATVTLASGTNQLLGVQLYKNGDTAVAHSKARTLLGATSEEQITSHADLMLASGDYIEMWISNETGTPNATVELGYLFAVGMFA